MQILNAPVMKLEVSPEAVKSLLMKLNPRSSNEPNVVNPRILMMAAPVSIRNLAEMWYGSGRLR